MIKAQMKTNIHSAHEPYPSGTVSEKTLVDSEIVYVFIHDLKDLMTLTTSAFYSNSFY